MVSEVMLNNERRIADDGNRTEGTPSPVSNDNDHVARRGDGPAMEHRLPPVLEGPLADILQSGAVTDATRGVLQSRLAALDEPWPVQGAFFAATELATLRAVVDRLVPQDHRQRPVDIAIEIDRRLAQRRSSGWRPDVLPSDGKAYRIALRGFDEFAGERHGRHFVELNALQQDALIAHVQRGRTLGAAWAQLDSAVFFTELLAEVTEIYYSDPVAQVEIGYAGFADQPGWDEIGLNRSDPREPAVPSLGQRSPRRPE
jgi:hypothetical protein